jgi:hypothetical protein
MSTFGQSNPANSDNAHQCSKEIVPNIEIAQRARSRVPTFWDYACETSVRSLLFNATAHYFLAFFFIDASSSIFNATINTDNSGMRTRRETLSNFIGLVGIVNRKGIHKPTASYFELGLFRLRQL